MQKTYAGKIKASLLHPQDSDWSWYWMFVLLSIFFRLYNIQRV